MRELMNPESWILFKFLDKGNVFFEAPPAPALI